MLRRRKSKSSVGTEHAQLAVGVLAGLAIVLWLVRLTHNRISERAANQRFALRPDKPLGPEVRRAARSEVAMALATLASSYDEVAPGSVHDSRKRLRKVRSLLRLTQDELGKERFEYENQAVGDIARRLSQARDAHVLVLTLDALLERYPREFPAGAFDGLRAALQAGSADEHSALSTELWAPDGVLSQLRRLLGRVEEWELPDGDDLGDLRSGAKGIYTRGRKAYKRARKTRKTDDLHRLRRRSKDLRHGVRLAGGDEAVVEAAKELTTVLGDEHDLAVLDKVARRHLVTMHPGHEVLLSELIAKRRKELQREARVLAKDLYSDKPSKATKKIFKRR